MSTHCTWRKSHCCDATVGCRQTHLESSALDCWTPFTIRSTASLLGCKLRAKLSPARLESRGPTPRGDRVLQKLISAREETLMATRHEGIIARWYDLVDGVVDGDPADM